MYRWIPHSDLVTGSAVQMRSRNLFCRNTAWGRHRQSLIRSVHRALHTMNTTNCALKLVVDRLTINHKTNLTTEKNSSQNFNWSHITMTSSSIIWYRLRAVVPWCNRRVYDLHYLWADCLEKTTSAPDAILITSMGYIYLIFTETPLWSDVINVKIMAVC